MIRGRAENWDLRPCRRAPPWRDKTDMSQEPVTHQCPYCELRFAYHVEIKDHVLNDHPEHASTASSFEPYELPH